MTTTRTRPALTSIPSKVDIKLGTTFTLFQAGRKRLNPSYFLCVFRDVDTDVRRQAITQSIGDAVGPLLLELTEGTSDPLNGVVQLYQGDWMLTVYEQVSATNLDAANANRTVWSELVRVSAQCDADPGPQPYDPCAGCGDVECTLCGEIAKIGSTAQAIVDCIDDAGKTEAVQALICDPCPPTTVNEVESETPTITVLQGGNPVGTLNPATGVHTVPECDPCPPPEPCPIDIEVLNSNGDLVDSASIPDPCEQEGPVVLTAPDGRIFWDGVRFTEVVSDGTIDIDCDTRIPAAYVLDGGSKTGTYKVDGAVNGKTRYRLDANHTLEYSGTRWECVHPGPDDQAAPGGEGSPWDADWSGTSLTVTQATIGQYCDDCEPQEPCPVVISINETEVLTVDDPCVEPTVNIEVVNEDDTQVGSLVGGQWVVPTAKSLCTLITEAETTEEITDCIRSAGKRTDVQCNLMGTAEVANAVTEFMCFPADVRAAILASECTPSVFDTLRVQFQPYANEARYDFTAADAGTYDTPTNDGGSGTITYSINGGAFAAWPGATAFVATDYIVIRRTTSTTLGWVQIEQ